jgi:hypothetical protein
MTTEISRSARIFVAGHHGLVGSAIEEGRDEGIPGTYSWFVEHHEEAELRALARAASA